MKRRGGEKKGRQPWRPKRGIQAPAVLSLVLRGLVALLRFSEWPLCVAPEPMVLLPPCSLSVEHTI